MRKEKNCTRQQFEQYYRFWRMYGDSVDFIYFPRKGNPALTAAEYAYDARFYEVTGWLSRRRHSTWVMKNLMRDPSWGIPF